MRKAFHQKVKALRLIFNVVLLFPLISMSQENPRQVISYEDYAAEIMEQEDDFLSSIEEWQNMIDQWLEKPLCINNEEADWLMEYKIINLYQLNKLKEYRFMYGNLLSVYELTFIDGWDFQTVRKVIPLITTNPPKTLRKFNKFTFRSIRQSLILKTAFNTIKSKGYKTILTDENVTEDPMYTGSAVRLALRYDLEYRNKIALGLRMEKDPGEPFLTPAVFLNKKVKTPDLLSGYIQIKQLGPVQSIILGNYRINFGYGINIAGGQTGIKSRNGMTGMAHRIRPQTSVSESGFFRGAALSASLGRFSLSGFASIQKIDGTSVETDSLTGKPISFSSIDRSGLHRTLSELEKRKSITEKVFGGCLIYQNNWLKTGLIAIYNKFDAAVIKSNRPYAIFGFSSNENLVAGFSATLWLPKIQVFTEASFSRNKGMAILSGMQMMPVPGTLFTITHRHFGVNYQNWYGSGFISTSRNTNENGLQASIRVELPKKWLVEAMTDISHSQWVQYDLAAPSRQREIRVLTEKAWPRARSIIFSFRYTQSDVNDPDNSVWISHPKSSSQYKLQIEGRIEAMKGVRLKSRVECKLVPKSDQDFYPGWLVFQDIEIAPEQVRTKFWLRICFFDVKDYESRIYAYENDVLYDFTSFMHFGKGVRGIISARLSPLKWLDCWIRLSTIYYTDKYIGSGWDELESRRQNEIEIQIRLKIQD